MAANGIYAATPRYEIATTTASNTAWDGTGTIVTLFTAGPNGSRIDDIGWGTITNSTAGFLKFFFRKASSDPWKFEFGAATPTQTVSTSAGIAPYAHGVTDLSIILSASAQVGIATHAPETWNVHITNAGDF